MNDRGQTVGRHVALLGHIILIRSQPVFDLYPYSNVKVYTCILPTSSSTQLFLGSPDIGNTSNLYQKKTEQLLLTWNHWTKCHYIIYGVENPGPVERQAQPCGWVKPDNRKLNRFEIESDEQCEQWLLPKMIAIGSRSIQSEHKAVSNWTHSLYYYKY
jgi:hypothetical protein